MSRRELDNLVRTGALREEAPSRTEIEGLLHSAESRLRDALNPDNSDESRFDLAYNAAHALALAALRWQGYRPDKRRYVVFQALPHSLGVEKKVTFLLAKCHESRNRIEYGGAPPVEEKLLEELLAAAQLLLERVRELPPIQV